MRQGASHCLSFGDFSLVSNGVTKSWKAANDYHILLINTNWDLSLIDILYKSHNRFKSFDLFGPQVEPQQKTPEIYIVGRQSSYPGHSHGNQNSSLFALTDDLKTVEEAADHML